MPEMELQPQSNSLEFWLNDAKVPEKIWPKVEHSVGSPALLNRRAHVLHEVWGVGRVIHANTGASGGITVSFADGDRTVPNSSLRYLLPRTKVAQLIERSTPQVSAWMVRKADEQGTIKPDLSARFAGHHVHYYDAARIPLLIDKLLEKDPWSINTLVIHSEYGPGSVIGLGPEGGQRTEQDVRRVRFCDIPSPLFVSVQKLRHLVPSATVAQYLGVNRKVFAKLAKSREVYPDYVHSNTRLREFYDEAQIENIRRRWLTCSHIDRFPRGSLVKDSQGEVARVESTSPQGILQVSYLGLEGSIVSLDPATASRLVTLRELARMERMSRYRLTRLLTAAGIRPAYQDLRAIYFDASIASLAVRAQSSREASAISLVELSKQLGISLNVLADRVRQGCIRTVGGAAYAVDLCEAKRIKEVVRALQSQTDNLQTLGVCKLQPRGRAGKEVVSWNIDQLVSVALPLTLLQQKAFFGGVAWLCTGAGRQRFIDSLRGYLLSLYSRPKGDAGLTRGANVLMALLQHLPEDFARYQRQLTFVASGASQFYSTTDKVQGLARRAGLDNQAAYDRFHWQINESVADLLTCECSQLRMATSTPVSRPNDCFYPEDEFRRGAVVVCVTDQHPKVGFIVGVEQQSWNPVSREWDKTVLVRFADGDCRLNPRSRTVQMQQRQGGFTVLLSAAQVNSVLHKFEVDPQGRKMHLSASTERKAS